MSKEKNKGKLIVENILNEDNYSKEEFATWVNSNKENLEDLEKYQKIWDASGKVASSKEYKSGEGWQKVDAEIQKSKTRKLFISKLVYAASGIAATLIILISLNFYFNKNESFNNFLLVSTEYGNRSEVVLPDGTMVSLNAGSDIEYAFDRKKEIRTVNFSGEAYFKVAKSHQPFVVNTNEGLQVKVLGTEFNLSAYADETEIFTTLLEGSVELSNDQGEKLLMVPGQIARYQKGSNDLSIVEGNPKHNYGWLDDKIYLDDLTLAETAKLLERKYGVKINLFPVGLGNEIHYTGVLEEESIIDVLDALKHLSGIQYEISGKEVTITK